jgi:acyl carrier protein
MTNDENLDATIKAIFRRVFDVSPEQISDQTGWGDLERWDSLGHLMLLDALREEFRIQIPPEVALDMSSVAEIKRILRALHVGEVVN